MKSKFRQFQIVLLQIYAGYRELDHALASYNPRSHTPGWDATGYAEDARKYAKRDIKRLHRHIDYLKRVGYVERVQEGEEQLLKLTAKGKYELLRLRFVEHLMQQKKELWDRKWWIVIFDIPEQMKKYRNFFRLLLKKNGFKMVQRSVWITPYNPRPYINDLLVYLRLSKYFEIIEADCDRCSPALFKKFKP
ncbi:CRISPR-associated endonuclease Cas2 [Candidatus Uhrbacteria bacterium]|nr:CRISPR-associated endonuclease Cas2 [Candidatus Uhrbacteria bacterium]